MTESDPFLWLEDAKSPKTQEWVANEAARTRAALDALPQRPLLRQRLSELLYLPAVGVPVKAGGRYFYARKEAGKEKAVEVVKEKGKERVLLDPAALSADGSVSLGVWVPNTQGTKVAYSLRQNNSDEATLHLLDVATGKTLDTDVIPGAKYAGPSWLPDGSGYFYTWVPTDPAIPTADRPGHAEVRFHCLGDDPAKDAVLHGATGDARTFLSASVDEEGRYLIATISHGWAETDLFYRDLKKADDGWHELAKGLKGETSVVSWRGFFTILTADGEGESHGAVYRVAAADPAREKWTRIVPPSDAVLQSIAILGGKLFLLQTKDASNALEIRELDGSNPRSVALPGIGSLGGLSGWADDDEVFFHFASFTIPPHIFRLDAQTGAVALWDEMKFPVDPAPYGVRQVFVASKDGTRVPMFLVGRKDLIAPEAVRDGSSPVLLSGYGGFAVSMEPYFSASVYAWLEAGGLYAVANLRGGGEYGEEWHRAGMLGNKQNVFDDFLACAQWLVDQKYTRPAKLAITGGSNGGLLVGAAMTQRPDLFGAVVCAVPLLDMLRYTQFGSGRTWIEEYGDPADPAAAKWLAAYSP
ncbi:MAG TPA: prolyl oligopeptidase family serine peptidase, partial [Candidatus Methylacidiphilales bacterium]